MALFVDNISTLAIHLTEKCNLYCTYCYLKDRKQQDITMGLIDEAIVKIHPQELFLYGGEPLVKYDLIKDIVKKYPDIKFTLMTNGTMLTNDKLDFLVENNFKLFITLESFNYENQCEKRPMTKEQFKNILNAIGNYANKLKIVLVKNLYKDMKDFGKFYKMAKIAGVYVDTFPIIDKEFCNFEDTNFYQQFTDLPAEVINDIIKQRGPLTMPKLRMHVDGMISRTMTYEPDYNICHVSEWKDEYKNKGLLPHSKQCENCQAKNNCIAVGIFPFWLYKYEVEGIKLDDLFICQMSKFLYKKYILRE